MFTMSECMGTQPCGTRIDTPMKEFLYEEADHLGTTPAELQRRLFDFYRESSETDTPCPHCGTDLTISLES